MFLWVLSLDAHQTLGNISQGLVSQFQLLVSQDVGINRQKRLKSRQPPNWGNGSTSSQEAGGECGLAENILGWGRKQTSVYVMALPSPGCVPARWVPDNPPPHFSKGAVMAARLHHGVVKRLRSCLVWGASTSVQDHIICAMTSTSLLGDMQGDNSDSPSVHLVRSSQCFTYKYQKMRSSEGTWEAHRIVGMNVCVLCLVTQLCPILCDPVNCSPPGSSVHEILQARILESDVMPSSRVSS